MSKQRPTPLFSADAPVFEPVPDESQHPSNFTARLRRLLLSDEQALFRAEKRQAEYVQAEADAPAQPRH